MLLPSGIESLVQDQLQLDASDEHAVRISRAGSGHAGRAATSPFTQKPLKTGLCDAARGTRHAGHGGRDETHANTRPHEGTRENANTSPSVKVSHGTQATRVSRFHVILPAPGITLGRVDQSYLGWTSPAGSVLQRKARTDTRGKRGDFRLALEVFALFYSGTILQREPHFLRQGAQTKC